MSEILDSLKEVEGKPDRCHVRVSDHMTYGPVALDTVCQWAAQGRITCESELSYDRNEWVPVDQVPALEMQWIASAKGGDYGPFNLHALGQLVRRGMVAPDATLTHRDNGETLSVEDALHRASELRPLDAASERLLKATANGTARDLVSHPITMTPDPDQDMQGADADETLSMTQLQSECDRLRSENITFATELESAVSTQSELEVALANSKDACRTMETRLHEQTSTLTRRIEEVESALNETRTTLKERDAEVELINKARAAEQARATEEIEGLKSGMEAASRHLDEREAEFETQRADMQERLDAVRVAGAEHEAERGLTVDELNQQMEELTRRQAESDARLREMEVEAEALKSELEIAQQEVSSREKQLMAMKDEVQQKDEAGAPVADGLTDREKQHLEERIVKLERALEAKADAVSVRETALVGRDAALAEKDRVITDRDQALAELKKKLSEASDALVQAADRADAQKDSASADDSALASRIAELEAAQKTQADAAAKADADLKAANERASEMQTQLEALEKTLAENKQALTEKEQALAENKKALTEKDKALAEQEKLLTEKDEALAQKTTALTEREQALAEKETALETAQAAVASKDAEAPEAEAAPKAEADASEPPAADEWYLRYDDENMVGPVAFDELLAWAKDCRVAPDHEVSSDQETWTQASEVPTLEMEWMVTLVDGTEYGPINKHAIHDLIADGSVAEDAELTHHETGKTLTASDVDA